MVLCLVFLIYCINVGQSTFVSKSLKYKMIHERRIVYNFQRHMKMKEQPAGNFQTIIWPVTETLWWHEGTSLPQVQATKIL
jgi:beta-lactamase regulating signal transducer with metallopeptidase domain